MLYLKKARASPGLREDHYGAGAVTLGAYLADLMGGYNSNRLNR